jgi:hypothetical protein
MTIEQQIHERSGCAFHRVLLYVILNGAFGVRRRVIFFDSLEAAAFAYVFAGLFQRRT